MLSIETNAEQIVATLAAHGSGRSLCVLDSCGVGRPGSNLLIAGIDPVDVLEIKKDDSAQTLSIFDEKLAETGLAAVFTISYDLGPKLLGLSPQTASLIDEPDIYMAFFEALVIHDYDTGRTWVSGDSAKARRLVAELQNGEVRSVPVRTSELSISVARSNFDRSGYIETIEQIKELIRKGETYQTNLTQQITVKPQSGLGPEEVFLRLCRDHPAPFAAYLDRGRTKVVSISPERFIRMGTLKGGAIEASPIKGTRRRGSTETDDMELRRDLVRSPKDRAENTMIVDLMRNDLGRICEFGSVEVTDLCRIEEHPTLFHLVSNVRGRLRNGLKYSDVVRAVFPSGSITGAPKINTMRIISEIEPDARGLSMGAIGCRIPSDRFGVDERFEMSVAIRTMVFREGQAVFNVGGGIVIDSDPALEYGESLLKATAMLKALNAELHGS